MQVTILLTGIISLICGIIALIYKTSGGYLFGPEGIFFGKLIIPLDSRDMKSVKAFGLILVVLGLFAIAYALLV